MCICYALTTLPILLYYLSNMNERNLYFTDTVPDTHEYFEKDTDYQYFEVEDDSVEITVDSE